MAATVSLIPTTAKAEHDDEAWPSALMVESSRLNLSHGDGDEHEEEECDIDDGEKRRLQSFGTCFHGSSWGHGCDSECSGDLLMTTTEEMKLDDTGWRPAGSWTRSYEEEEVATSRLGVGDAGSRTRAREVGADRRPTRGNQLGLTPVISIRVVSFT